MMFVGWEGVGLCSYLLIGYYFEKKSAADAAKKAMIVNRIGDVGVMIAMFMALRHFGTLDFYSGHFAADSGVKGILEQAPSLATLVVASPLAMTIVTTLALMLFWGCTGKSAQIPLYTWLPDAMEGPTPVSALIHAATMVTAGVYLVSRMHTVFELSPIAMETVSVIGISTALFAATIGLVQNDIKRVLAYSTVSQLGYMFAACGVGAFSAGMFHVLTHAFFKACLFLGSGAVIHAMEHAIHHRQEHEGHGHADEAHDEHGGETVAQKSPHPDPNDPQDMRNMGGLKNRIPLTHWMMWIATLAIAGIPLTSGFFSKDEILYQTSGQSFLLWAVGALTAALTAFYMMRLMYKTFYGSPKTEDARNASGELLSMSIPISILGVLALIGGYLWLPSIAGNFHPLESFLEPASGAVLDHNPHPFASEGALLLVSSAIAIFFVCLSYFQYKAKDGADLYISAAVKPRNGLYQAVLNKYYVDEAYNFVFVRGGKQLALFLWRILDNDLVDGIVNGIGALARFIGGAFRATQTGYVRNYALSIFFGVLIVVIACLAEYQHGLTALVR
jgi:NADH-quinone oxidoreductase subunit L